MTDVFQSEQNLIKIDRVDATTKYIGIGANGASDNDIAWKIIKETFNSSGDLVLSQTYKSLAKWADRADLEY